MAYTPAQRSLVGSIGGHTSWANTSDRTARTAPGRNAALAAILAKLDPDGVMTPEQQRNAIAAHFRRLALRSSRSRAKASAAREVARGLDADAAEAEAELAAAEQHPGGDAT
jgi:hypothetical protein